MVIKTTCNYGVLPFQNWNGAASPNWCFWFRHILSERCALAVETPLPKRKEESKKVAALSFTTSLGRSSLEHILPAFAREKEGSFVCRQDSREEILIRVKWIRRRNSSEAAMSWTIWTLNMAQGRQSKNLNTSDKVHGGCTVLIFFRHHSMNGTLYCSLASGNSEGPRWPRFGHDAGAEKELIWAKEWLEIHTIGVSLVSRLQSFHHLVRNMWHFSQSRLVWALLEEETRNQGAFDWRKAWKTPTLPLPVCQGRTRRPGCWWRGGRNIREAFEPPPAHAASCQNCVEVWR